MPPTPLRPEREEPHAEDADREQDQRRIVEEPARAEREQELQVPPAVAPGAQVRRAAAAVGAQHGGHLCDGPARHRRPNHELARELHAGRAQAELARLVGAEGADAAVEVADVPLEEQPADEREHRVAQVLVQEGHGTGLDPALEPVAHHQVVAGTHGLDEGAEVVERVAVVGIGHQDVSTARGLDASADGGAVAAHRHVDHARPGRAGEVLRPVGAAVVGEDHLARHAQLAHRGERLAHAHLDGLGLVEARQHHRQLELAAGVAGGRGC